MFSISFAVFLFSVINSVNNMEWYEVDNMFQTHYFYILQFCCALRYLATGANYSIVSDFQGISRSTLCRSIDEVVRFLCSLSHEYIVFPSERNHFERNALQFYRRYQKACTIGVVDGTLIAIQRPEPDVQFSYVNRKMFHSMNVMVS